ncbi:hypothetical protein KQI88_09660 [Alkaliphilus sp. MSJ-5]|uniref:DUF2383 domain-containing protein n=1 Tax=Alkaliphilus flagellatus TaxID=2841507 RepID=A0ABS6G2H7_9FIRM|nr:hypothetical protein [Alkaliphilus flagellatus]MBU5676685.1 hypothetical protein [Alkaliphilus flagellatus]
MKVARVDQRPYVEPVKSIKSKHIEKGNTKSEKPVEEAVKYEPSKDDKPVTYQKTGHVYDHEAVAKLKRQSEEAYAHLRGLIEKLLLKQGHSLKTITSEEWAGIQIDEPTRLEAQSMIAPGGPLSAEAVSDRIVDFAKAISGGDVEKLDKLRDAIEEGFKQAESILGQLPEVSKETYRLVMEKLDKWSKEGKSLEK